MTTQSDVRVFVTVDEGSVAERAWWCRGFGAPDVRWADAIQPVVDEVLGAKK